MESVSREWKNRCKQGSRLIGKSVAQSEDVMRTEIKVGKFVSLASRKAAIVYMIPVP